MPNAERHTNTSDGDTSDAERRDLENHFFELQRERTALTQAIVRLRQESPERRPRAVMHIIVALLRLQRANRHAAAALDGRARSQ
jgi:hypothetical protein